MPELTCHMRKCGATNRGWFRGRVVEGSSFWEHCVPGCVSCFMSSFWELVFIMWAIRLKPGDSSKFTPSWKVDLHDSEADSFCLVNVGGMYTVRRWERISQGKRL